jgi:hypothetical protein
MPPTIFRRNRGPSPGSRGVGENGVAGEETSLRLTARSTRPGLGRRSLAGGGEVYEGPLAQQALDVLGARAMTVDRSIVVGDDFDPGRTESQALLAHEQVHVAGSGGRGSDEVRDAEEIAARSAESMVIHRAQAGPDDAQSADATNVEAGSETSPAPPKEDEHEPKPERGYTALQSQGLDHEGIVERLVQDVMEAFEQDSEAGNERCGGGGF